MPKSSKSLLYGVGIAVGATAGIALAPSLLSTAGLTVGSVAARSAASGMKSIVVQGAMSGLIALAGSASTVGLGVAGSAAAGTVRTAIGAASAKAAKCFIKELKKGVTTQTLCKGIRKRSKPKQHFTTKSVTEKNDKSRPAEVVITSSDDDSS